MTWVSGLWRAGRVLGRAQGFTLTALTALALGIGAATAIFSVVDTVLLRPLPFHNSKQLLVIYERNPTSHKDKFPAAGANYLDWSTHTGTLAAVGAISDTSLNLTGGPNGRFEPEEIKAERVTASLFPLLDVQPVLGRVFQPEEDVPGHGNVALLSYRLWQRHFGADPAIAGKTIRLRDQSYTVVGVLPADFAVMEPEVEVFVPLALDAGDPRSVLGRRLIVIARMRPGVTVENVRAEMAVLGSALERINPALDRGWLPSVYSLEEEIVGGARESLAVLSAAVGLLLVIACANVANLMLARGASREKEIALRAALGASRRRIAAELLQESLLLGLGGGILGLAVARAAIALVARFGPADIPRLALVEMNLRLLLFAIAVSLATGLLFGLAPALVAAKVDLNSALREGGRGGTTGHSKRLLRNGLVVVEVMVALVVLVVAGLLIRSFERLRSTSAGLETADVLTYRMPMAGGRNGSPTLAAPFLNLVLTNLAALPGVRSAGAVNTLPLTGLGGGIFFSVEGQAAPPPGERPIALTRSVTPDYFRVMGIPLLAGRPFADSDGAESPGVLIVSQRLARRMWGQQNPLGAKVTLDLSPPRTAEVAGVVGDIAPERVDGDPWPVIYAPYPQIPTATMVLVLKTAGDPAGLASSVERVVHRLDPDQPLADRRTMEEVAARSLGKPRFNALVLAIFAGVAFTLAALGVYAVVAYDVTQRTQELAIRAALGAQSADLLRMVLREGAGLALIGIGLGLAAALASTRVMASMLFGVTPLDLVTFVIVPTLLAAMVLVATYLPARRAAALAPLAGLRHQ